MLEAEPLHTRDLPTVAPHEHHYHDDGAPHEHHCDDDGIDDDDEDYADADAGPKR